MRAGGLLASMWAVGPSSPRQTPSAAPAPASTVSPRYSSPTTRGSGGPGPEPSLPGSRSLPLRRRGARTGSVGPSSHGEEPGSAPSGPTLSRAPGARTACSASTWAPAASPPCGTSGMGSGTTSVPSCRRATARSTPSTTSCTWTGSCSPPRSPTEWRSAAQWRTTCGWGETCSPGASSEASCRTCGCTPAACRRQKSRTFTTAL
mmetsp:Transcript_147070/g.256779  ORF Transcript_147070/g.256779 Transcript_147070/m.256779 type:complete len:205 (-) Transcript_147070:1733-2347(-)